MRIRLGLAALVAAAASATTVVATAPQAHADEVHHLANCVGAWDSETANALNNYPIIQGLTIYGGNVVGYTVAETVAFVDLGLCLAHYEPPIFGP